MNTLNDSVIICDTPPKVPKKKVPLGTRREHKGVKKTFYESPLKHIQLSSKRWKQIQAQRKLMKEAKQIINNKKNSSLLIKEAPFQDSIIILSDNESESSNQKDQSKCRRKRKRKKTQELLIQDNQNSQCSHDSNKSLCQSETEIEKCPKRRKNSVLPDTNATCLLVSDTEDSEIVSVDLDNENIAPASGSMNQSSDDIVVVWSSKKSSPLSTNYSDGEKPLTEEENKIFMVDCCPNSENLRLLECNEESTSNKCAENTEVPTEKGTEENEDTSDEEQDPKYLPFSKQGLKLPKAHNISKTLKIRKPIRRSTFLQYRRYISEFSNKRMPATCTQTASELASNEPFTIKSGFKVTRFQSTRFQSTRFEPPRFEPPRFEPPRFEPSRFEPPRFEPPRLEPPSCEPARDEPFELNPSRDEPATPSSSKKLREIIIDGNNVAMAYKNNRMFSEEGIMLVMDYFQRRGHVVKVFIPQYRRSRSSPSLEKLYKEGVVIFTPSRKIGGRSIIPYDDRFILEYATVSGGIVISSDQYRDLYREKPEWRDTIENRLLAPTFVGNYVMFPEDPLGRNGPNLEEFLRH